MPSPAFRSMIATAIHLARHIAGHIAIAIAMTITVGFAACGGKAATVGACGADPFSCAAGETCWPIDKAGSFQCLPSKPDITVGVDCEILVGHTSCGDGLICVTSETRPDAGTLRSYCTGYCDPARAAHGCSGDDSCVLVTLLDGVSVHACVERAPRPVLDGSVGN